MKISKKDILMIVLIGITFLASLIFYSDVPNTVPTHWNINGQIDGWGPKWIILFLFPIINLVILGLMTVLPSLDPLKQNYKNFQKEYENLKVLFVLLFTFLYLVTLKSSISKLYFPINTLFPVGFGVFFIYIGYIMPRFKPNWFVGIKTPWTLSSSATWEKTHQLGGKLFMLAGIASLITGAVFPRISFPVFMVSILAAGFIPLIYSYFGYKKNQKKL